MSEEVVVEEGEDDSSEENVTVVKKEEMDGEEEKKSASSIVFGSLSEAEIAKLTGNERIAFIFSHEQELWLRSRLHVYMSEFVDVDAEKNEREDGNPYHAVDQFRSYQKMHTENSSVTSDWLMHQNPFIRAQAALIYSILRREYRLMKHRMELIDQDEITGVLHREQVNAIYSVLGADRKKKKFIATTRQPGVRKRRVPNGYIIYCKELTRTNNWSGTKGKIHQMWANLPEAEKNHFNKLAAMVVQGNPKVYKSEVKTLLNNKNVRQHLASISAEDIQQSSGMGVQQFHQYIRQRNKQNSSIESEEEEEDWQEEMYNAPQEEENSTRGVIDKTLYTQWKSIGPVNSIEESDSD